MWGVLAAGLAGLVLLLVAGAAGRARRCAGLPPASWQRRRWFVSGAAIATAAAAAVELAAGPDGRSLWARTLQLGLITFLATPLAVLATPAGSSGRRAAGRRAEWPAGPGWRSGASWLIYAGVLVAWRLPGSLDALARHRAVVVVELVSAVLGSWLLWYGLVGGGAEVAVRSAFQRMVLATPAAWTAWIAAYSLGFSSGRRFPAYDRLHGGLSAAADQEIAAMILFAMAAAAFVPIIFFNLSLWLGADRDGAGDDRPGGETLAGVLHLPGGRGPRLTEPGQPWS